MITWLREQARPGPGDDLAGADHKSSVSRISLEFLDDSTAAIAWLFVEDNRAFTRDSLDEFSHLKFDASVMTRNDKYFSA